MFDDSKRLDALEGQMKGVQKASTEFPAEIARLNKAIEARLSEIEAREDRRGKIQNDFITDVEKIAMKTEASLTKALQRISVLEQQVRKLSK